MSNGTIVHDSRTPVMTDVGPGFPGNYYSKTFAGSNTPRRPPKPPRPKPFRNRDGSWNPPVDAPQNQPPKRAYAQENGYTVELISHHDDVMQFSTVGNPTVFYSCTHLNTFGGVAVDFGSDANSEIKLLGKLRDRVVGSSFNAAVAMAEGRESLETITSAATAIYQATQALRKKDFVGASQALFQANKRRSARSVRTSFTQGATNTRAQANDAGLSIAQQWLNLQYGWGPLVQDLYDGAQFLAHLSSVPLQDVKRVKVRRRGTAQGAPSNTRFANSVCYSDLRIKAILREVDIVKLSGLTDPASLVWESLPYSFVADWVIPIGNYLSARSLAQALTGTYVRSTFRLAEVSDPVCVDPNIRVFGDTFRYKRMMLDRYITTSLSVPLPEVKPLGEWPTWRRALSSVSLLATAFGKPSTRWGS